MVKKTEDFYAEIEGIKEKMKRLGDIRPGVLSRQISPHNGKKYWQISYTYKMKSRTEYVRPDQVKRLRAEAAEFKKFKVLTQKWIDLALQLSQQKSVLAKLNRIDK